MFFINALEKCSKEISFPPSLSQINNGLRWRTTLTIRQLCKRGKFLPSMINFTHKMMERKVINCNNNSFNSQLSSSTRESESFAQRFFLFPLFSLLPSINKRKHVCFLLPKNVFFMIISSLLLLISLGKIWQRRRVCCEKQEFLRKNQARENIFRIFFVRLESATFGKWSRGSTVVSVVEKTTKKRRIFFGFKF